MSKQTIVVAVALLVAVAAVPVAGLAATAQTGAQNESSEDSVAPGQRLSGVVGVQGAELEGEVDRRAFGLSIARAATNEGKAAVLAGQVGAVEQRIERLERRNESLAAAHANGSMSEGAYRARMAKLSAEMETARALANATSTSARGLPADLLASKGINATAIQTLRERASQLGGPQVAEIARDIGAGAGRPADAGRPAGVGPDSAGPDSVEETRDTNATQSPPTDDGPPAEADREESARGAGR